MYFELERTNLIMNIVKENILQNEIPVTEIRYSKGKDYPNQWESFENGSLWGGYDLWYWFKFELQIPDEFAGKTVSFSLKTGNEEKWNGLNPQFLAYINGKISQALDTNHTEIILSDCAEAGTVYQIELQAYSGTANPTKPYECNPVKMLPPRSEFKASLSIHSRADEQLYYNLYAAYLTAKILKPGDADRIQIEKYLVNTLNLLDLSVISSESYYRSVADANNYIEKEFYDSYCGKSPAIANCVGHTHIDVAWLWTLEQTRHKAVRSFSTVLNLMKEYPEYIFMSSQPQLYQYVKEDAPEIYEQIKERVKEGRWEVEGAMWLEADCNLSSGESLIRQIIHGKQFFMNEFGKDSKTLWLPDVFGYSAAMPQILRKSGIENFVTSKISWNEYNHMPNDTFLWEGIDGSEVFTQFINATEISNTPDDHRQFFSTYNAQIMPSTITGGWLNYQQKKINNETLVSFGYGDGGGGPTREMLEMNRRMEKGLPGCPKTRITSSTDAPNRIRENVIDNPRLPKWVGELYLEYHRGTYTTMARNKHYNRKSEFAAEAAETLCLADKLYNGAEYPAQEIHDIWETILLNQFHNIIPGSSIEEVYKDSLAQYEQLLSRTNQMITSAVENLAEHTAEKGLLVYNPTGFCRSEIVSYDGKNILADSIPAHGWKVVPMIEYTPENQIQADTNHVETPFYYIEFDEKAQISRLYDKENDREVLKPGEKGNVLQIFEDRPYNFDAWDINIYYEDKQWVIDALDSFKLICCDGGRAVYEIKRSFLRSTITQYITVYADRRRIDFDNDIDWKEDHMLLKTSFPVDVLSPKATYEIQYGNVERPTHRNTSWDAAKFEVCAHKWADLSEDGYGVSILNDCKYGHDIHGSEMRLTLLKCATHPNPAADKERHIFKYSLLPHSGDYHSAGTVREAYAINCPLILCEAAGGGSLPGELSIAQTDQENIVIEVIKEAYDKKGTVIRLYDAFGRRSNGVLTFCKPIQHVWECDMNENKETGLTSKDHRFSFSLKPFEIKTFYIEA